MIEFRGCSQTESTFQSSRKPVEAVPVKTHASLALLFWTFSLGFMTILILLGMCLLSSRPLTHLLHSAALGQGNQPTQAH